MPGVYVGILLEQPTTFHPAVAYGWRDLLVGTGGVVEVSSCR